MLLNKETKPNIHCYYSQVHSESARLYLSETAISFTSMALALDNPRRLICHKTKKLISRYNCAQFMRIIDTINGHHQQPVLYRIYLTTPDGKHDTRSV